MSGWLGGAHHCPEPELLEKKRCLQTEDGLSLEWQDCSDPSGSGPEGIYGNCP